jgi:hypothetical protein
MLNAAPWPFERIDVVAFIPVMIGGAPELSGSDVQAISETTDSARADGERDLRRAVLQAGPATRTTPPWSTGPVPFKIRRCVPDDERFTPFADDATREERARLTTTWFAERLYASDRRWHRAALPEDQFRAWADDDDLAEPNVLALELLRIAPLQKGLAPDGAPTGLLFIHAQPPLDQRRPLDALRVLTLKDRRSRDWVRHLLRGIASFPDDDHVRAYHLCLAQPRGALSGHDRDAAKAGFTSHQHWLWTLSTLQSSERYPVTRQNHEQLLQGMRRLSDDWTSALMRTGAAVLARPLDDDWEYDSDHGRFKVHYLAEEAPLLIRSLYADAIALGVMKGVMLDTFAGALAKLEDPTERARELIKLDGQFTRFRNTFWWQEIGNGRMTLFLRQYESSHNHGVRFQRLVSDFSDYSQKVERTELQRSNAISQGTNALIGLVTCFGVPLGILQVFGTGSYAVWGIVTLYMVTLALLPAADYIIGLSVADRRRPLIRIGWAVGWVFVIGVLLLLGILPWDSLQHHR